MISPADFVQDPPTTKITKPAQPIPGASAISGVTVVQLSMGEDKRGLLNELLTTRDGDIEPIVHVYQVHCLPGSVRAWQYHKWQSDRLAYTNGSLRVVLYDIRPDSPTLGKLEVHEFGEANRVLLTIPPYVVHAVQNIGTTTSSFVNLPTRPYDLANPDKFRLPINHPGIPYTF